MGFGIYCTLNYTWWARMSLIVTNKVKSVFCFQLYVLILSIPSLSCSFYKVFRAQLRKTIQTSFFWGSIWEITRRLSWEAEHYQAMSVTGNHGDHQNSNKIIFIQRIQQQYYAFRYLHHSPWNFCLQRGKGNSNSNNAGCQCKKEIRLSPPNPKNKPFTSTRYVCQPCILQAVPSSKK